MATVAVYYVVVVEVPDGCPDPGGYAVEHADLSEAEFHSWDWLRGGRMKPTALL